MSAPHLAFDALGNAVRRQIVDMLHAAPRSVGDIAAALPVSRPAVSRHLRLLEQAELVAFEERGTKNIYRLDPRGFEQAKAWLDTFWDDALGRFKELAEQSFDGGHA